VNTINEKKAQIAYGDIQKVYHGEGVIHEKLGQLTFIISANSFFQTNTFQAERLYHTVKEYAEFKPSDVVYDLYSGTGSIALFISDSVARVIGIENVPSAIEDAVKNAGINMITNCEFVLGDLKDRLTKDTDWMQTHPHPNVLVIDPPRSGMHPKVVQEVVRLGSRRIVYVSCNPATQARDVRTIVEGGYHIDAIQPLDMFPHTYHIENVVKLTRE
jgi:23S rRNA (uracil1939-C5)-methyltransferase